MNIPAVLRIAAQPEVKTREVGRAAPSSGSDSTRGRASQSGRVFEAPGGQAAIATQAAVIQFGSKALDLARQPDSAPEQSPAAEAAEVDRPSSPPEFDRVSGNDDNAPGDSDSSGNQTGGDQARRSSAPGEELSPDQQQQVSQMRTRDREVRAHEQAHKAAGAGHTGSIQLQYETGPDGKRYAVAGSVSIDTSGVSDDAEATLRKMEIVQRAAMAPADPSGADRQVAARAAQAARQAQAQLAAERYAKTNEHRPTAGNDSPVTSGPDPSAASSEGPARAEAAKAAPFRLVA